jgi:two-component system KDP operon response regulator KdpE
VLVVSGRTGSQDVVEALDAGADDYVTKPFHLDELLARLRALGRRGSATTEDEPAVRLGDVTVDLAARVVTRAGAGPVHLTPTEWQVLEILVRNPGRLVTRQTILTEIWGSAHLASSGYLRLYLSQLRKKLEAEPSAPRYLVTEQGMGYRFVPDA